MKLPNTALLYGDNANLRWNGTIFDSVSGLSGATINSAILTFYSLLTDSGSFSGTWRVEDTAAPTAYTTTNGNMSGRTYAATTQGGDGSDFGNWTANTEETFNVATLIQYLADNHDPSSIALAHQCTVGTGERVPASWNHATAAEPQLDIEYTAGGAAFIPKVMLF